MRFLFLEPFFGGSHREFALGLKEHSAHDIELVTLPARSWKWRMGGAALAFFRKLAPMPHYDGIVATDMMNLCDFMALTGPGLPPVLLYFHENQFSYPLMPGESLDLNYGLINAKSAVAATRVVFNSEFHRKAFLSQVKSFSSRMPDVKPGWMADLIAAKSSVVYPGCRFPAMWQDKPKPDDEPPLIIWNHRWEYDKNPEDFFNALEAVKSRERPFRLALLGERYGRVPPVFDLALKQFESQIVVSDFVRSRQAYQAWLQKGDVVISTAVQENFGISVVEAVGMGCIPLLPNRLSYPEIMPLYCHAEVLYNDQEELVEKLDTILMDIKSRQGLRQALAVEMQTFSWQRLITDFDRELAALADTI